MIRLILIFLCFVMTVQAHALELKEFASLPIMHEGRVKPMDSFARAVQKRISGQEQNAIGVLAEIVFNPAYAEGLPLLKVNDRDVAGLLSLPKRADKLFSYREIDAALQAKRDVLVSILKTPEEDWTTAQTNLIILQNNKLFLAELLASLSVFLPLSVELHSASPEALQPYTGRHLTYLEVLKFQESLWQTRDAIIQDKGDDFVSYSDAEQSIMQVLFLMDSLRMQGQNSKVFAVVPSALQKSGDGQGWLSPWQIMAQGQGGPGKSKFIKYWNELSISFHLKNEKKWSAALRDLKRNIDGKTDHGYRHSAHMLEIWYNKIHPFTLSLCFYLVCLVCLLGRSFGWGGAGRYAFYALCLGVVMHGLGILARVVILERPPVSTLYESVVFVGLITALYGCASKHKFGVVIGAFTAALLHLIAMSHDQDGDSMMMLTAVLNTNFWLATHVLCITAGYAFCLITSALAHISLYMPSRDGLMEAMHRCALWSLLLASVGTVLGGIWADQSWGRFWGWDPKENGALLIVLWLIWALHGRISGQMKMLGFTVVLAYLSVIVMLSWFGVNLLNVGLHAYGFTDKALWFLIAFSVIETLLIGWLYLRNRQGQVTNG